MTEKFSRASANIQIFLIKSYEHYQKQVCFCIPYYYLC